MVCIGLCSFAGTVYTIKMFVVWPFITTFGLLIFDILDILRYFVDIRFAIASGFTQGGLYVCGLFNTNRWEGVVIRYLILYMELSLAHITI